MSRKILTVTLFLVVVVATAGCIDESKENKKVERKLLTGTPTESYYEKAQEYFEEGNYTGALEFDTKQLEEDLKYYREVSAEIALDYNNIALDYDKLKDYNKSIETYQKVIKIDNTVLDIDNPERATTYYNIASSYDTLKLYDKALHFYLKSLKIDKDSESLLITYYDIAQIYDKKKSNKEALYYYKKALVLYKKSIKRDRAMGENITHSISRLEKR